MALQSLEKLLQSHEGRVREKIIIIMIQAKIKQVT